MEQKKKKEEIAVTISLTLDGSLSKEMCLLVITSVVFNILCLKPLHTHPVLARL